LGIATGIDSETVSWFLLKNYFRFVGPAQPGEALLSDDPNTNAKLIAIPVGGLNGIETEAMPACMDLLGGNASHLVVGAANHFDEAFLLLSCLCESGYPVGEAVRYVAAAIGDAGPTEDRSEEQLWLFGDPTLRLFPARPSMVETDVEAVNGSWAVTLKNSGPQTRIYHVQLQTDLRLAPTVPNRNDVHSATYSDGSVQHLFAYARIPLPDRLTLVMD